MCGACCSNGRGRSSPSQAKAAFSRGRTVYLPSDDETLNILATARSIAVVGLSDKPHRPSHQVAKFLKEAGYGIYPVNPHTEEAVGERAYPSLEEIPAKIDIVNIFRASEKVLPAVEPAINMRAKVAWMQEGVVNEETARRAEEAGLKVIMDRCLMKEYKRLM